MCIKLKKFYLIVPCDSALLECEPTSFELRVNELRAACQRVVTLLRCEPTSCKSSTLRVANHEPPNLGVAHPRAYEL